MPRRCLLRPASVRAGIALLAILPAAPGCRTAAPDPLDPAAHAAAFAARRPDDPAVLERHAAASPGLRFDPADGIGPAEGEAIALVYNADLRIARLRAGVARADAAAAGRYADPVFGVDLARITESVRHPWTIAANLALTIPLSGLPQAERATAEARAEAEAAEVIALEWETRIAVRRAYLERAALAGERDTLADLLERLAPLAGIAARMEASGEVPRTEARLFRAEERTREAELRGVEARIVEADLELRSLLGLSPGAPVAFVGGAAEAGDAAGTPPASGSGLPTGSPRLRAAEAAYRAAERAFAEEVRRGGPDLTLAPGAGKDDGNREATLGVSLPIPLFNGNAREVARARAERDVARAVAEAAAEQVLADLAIARARLAAAVAARDAIASGILPLTDANHEDAVAVARLGEVDTLVLLETLTRRHDARLRLVAAERNVALAGLRVRELTGPAEAAADAASGGPGSNSYTRSDSGAAGGETR